MDPIISPYLLYLVYVFNGIVLFSKMAIAFFGILLVYVISKKEQWKKIAAALMLSISICIFVPNESTMYKMIAVSFITPNNIELSGQALDKMLDSVVDKIIKIKNN